MPRHGARPVQGALVAGRGGPAGADVVLVERDEQLVAVGNAVAAAWAGAGGVVVVRGGRQCGKSAILEAVVAMASGSRVLRAWGSPDERHLPLAYVAQWSSPVARGDTVRIDPWAVDRDADEATPWGSPLASGAAVADLFAELHGEVRRLAGRGPLLLALDDVQWADATSWAALGYLLRRLRGLPVAVILGQGPGPGSGVRTSWSTPGGVVGTDDVLVLPCGGVVAATVVDVSPLSAAGTAGVLELAVGGAVPQRVVEDVWSASGGVPGLVLAMAHQPRPRRRAARAVSAPPGVPPSVAHRWLRGLSDAAVSVAEALAVAVGRADGPASGGEGVGGSETIALAAAMAVVGAEVAAPGDAIDELVAAGVVRVTAGGALAFDQRAVGAAVRAQVPPARRAAVHRRTFMVLAERGEVGRAADHAVAADLVGDDRAVAVLTSAAEDAERRGAADEAAMRYHQALSLVGAGPRSVRLRDARARALVMAGRPVEAWQLWRELLDEVDVTEAEGRSAASESGAPILDGSPSDAGPGSSTDTDPGSPTHTAPSRALLGLEAARALALAGDLGGACATLAVVGGPNRGVADGHGRGPGASDDALTHLVGTERRRLAYLLGGPAAVAAHAAAHVAQHTAAHVAQHTAAHVAQHTAASVASTAVAAHGEPGAVTDARQRAVAGLRPESMDVDRTVAWALACVEVERFDDALATAALAGTLAQRAGSRWPAWQAELVPAFVALRRGRPTGLLEAVRDRWASGPVTPLEQAFLQAMAAWAAAWIGSTAATPAAAGSAAAGSAAAGSAAWIGSAAAGSTVAATGAGRGPWWPSVLAAAAEAHGLAAAGCIEEAADRYDALLARVERLGIDQPGELPWIVDALDVWLVAGRRGAVGRCRSWLAATGPVHGLDHLLEARGRRRAPTSTQGLASEVSSAGATGPYRVASEGARPWLAMVHAFAEACWKASGTTSHEATSWFAVAAAQPTVNRLDRAIVHLRHGSWLRHHGEPRAARQPLTEAQQLAEGVGALRVGVTARAELAAAGGGRRVRGSGQLALTPQEQRVAQLVAEGRSTREAAAALHISPRTVETHLSAVYRKLHVRDRHDLRRRMNTSGGDATTRGLPAADAGGMDLEHAHTWSGP